ncbi:hypothetical protein [Bacillus sp. ES1-5]|uniref:hypothetical protein n=1 Tax=Bacillus sp. ES1-5 TaxID=1502999 RepID=UPI001F0C84D9|nr:hypothetical protein [Bacillus sp. ES1-5]
MDISKKKELLNLILNYNKEKHEKHLEHKNTVGNLLVPGSFKTINSTHWSDDSWLSQNSLPHTAITHLLDSYYQLPERPDLAFNSLWASINSLYSKLATEHAILNNTKIPGDAESIRIALKLINDVLIHKINYRGNEYEIGSLITNYLEYLPLQTFRFIASFILKGIVVNDFNPKYISSQFRTFKSKERFEFIYNDIYDSFGKSYKILYNVNLTNSDIKLTLNGTTKEEIKNNKRTSEGLTYQLALFLQELAIKRVSYIEKEEISVELSDDEKYLEFIFQTILYSIRNNTLHGNSSARLSSINANSAYLATSTFTYLYGHLFLSLLLYVSNEVKTQDLELNFFNLELWKHKYEQSLT